MTASSEQLLTVRGLCKYFPVGRSSRHFIHAVDDVSFTLGRGRILALVGESGSGKSTIARVLANLYPPTRGEAYFQGENILRLHGRRSMLQYRRRVQMVFQDPFGSLNPVKTIAHHIKRPLAIHKQTAAGQERINRIHELLLTVGLTPPDEVAAKYPHQLSGGQRQRVAFARALAVNPELILADEPISMLDVSIRMGILNLMSQLRREQGLSYLYITHDLASARYLADESMVLYAGQIMEAAPSDDLMLDPLHPYTQLLLAAVPDPANGLVRTRIEARGEIPTVIDPAPGCRFARRCPRVMPQCQTQTPPLIQVTSQRQVRCFLYGE